MPTEYYTRPLTFRPLKSISLSSLQEELKKLGFRSRDWSQPLLSGDFAISDSYQCASRMQVAMSSYVSSCLVFVPLASNRNPTSFEKNAVWLTFREDSIIDSIYSAYPVRPIEEAHLEPKLLTSYLGDEPFLNEEVTLGLVPPQCLNSIVAIEDNQFLEHIGVSPTGIMRALMKNVATGRKAQGGSTITQQLVKNYFLTSEKTFRRKIMELILSVLLEGQFTKDEILSTYINIIYMGKNGAYQIRGFGSASQYYFSKSISDLNLSECALMAALVNSPGLFNPFLNPDNATKRRSLVLEKMHNNGYISESERVEAEAFPLPRRKPVLATETAPYYIDAAKKELRRLNVPIEGHRIYLGLDLKSQAIAQDALVKSLETLEAKNKKIKALKDKGKTLEGLVLVADPITGLIEVAVGGRSYRMTQFNRAIDGHRQVGSIFKPFVYLTALLENSIEGEELNSSEGERPIRHPLSLIEDKKETYKYDGQRWTPQNYGRKYFGQVPMFFALKESLNAATVRLGMEVGLEKIIQTARALGVQSELKPLPAMLLGAFELYPIEVLQSYATLAQLGRKTQLGFVKRVETLKGELIFDHTPDPELAVDESATAVVVGMMKQVLLSGSARGVTASGFFHPAAGKTGTTSDNRDAWFCGFTPQMITLVWVGYDDNSVSGLTGSSGAVPVWSSIMHTLSNQYTPVDFPWPESTSKVIVDATTLSELNAFKEDETPTAVELIFKKGTEPRTVAF